MDIVVVIAGIMGIALETPQGVEVWPPTVREALTGYKRVDQLVRPDLRPTKIIESVCIDVYGSLLDALKNDGYTEAGNVHRLAPFPYDWRRDILTVADELDRFLAGLVQQHGAAAKIRLVCHSMGGLVARACLEKQRNQQPSWWPAVDLCVFLATPHEGAALALSRATGVATDTSLGLSPAQQRQVAGAPGFPAGYELFPSEDLLPIWDLDNAHLPFAGISVFNPMIANNYGLNPNHLTAARAFQHALDPSRKPANCRYFAIASAFHETVTRFDLQNGRLKGVSVASSGDGTVPIRSATALRVQTAFVRANHLGVAQSKTSHVLLAMLLGVKPPDIVAAGVVAHAAAAVVSVSQPVVTEDEPYEIAIDFGDAGAQPGRLVFEREQEGGAFADAGAITLDLATQAAKRLALAGPDLQPGRYKAVYQVDGQDVAGTDFVMMKRNDDE